MAHMKTFRFECAGCHSTSERQGKKCPTWCDDCLKARTRFLCVIATNDNYPRKSCKGCGIHMSNLNYGRAQFCEECADVRVRRHNGWSDPYATDTRLLFAANDNRPQVKTCLTCECDLPLDAFHKNATGGLGVSAECKECRAIMRSAQDRTQEYAARNAQRTDPTSAVKRQSEAVRRKRVKLAVKWHRRRKADSAITAKMITSYLAAFERKKEKAARRERKIAERPWLAPGLTAHQRRKIRIANDGAFAAAERLRRRLLDQTRLRKRGRCGEAAKAIRKAIKGAGSLPKFLGYSADDLRVHLESLFSDGMTWDAFHAGDIHLDHKTPLSHFDLTDDEQVREAWSLNNLQPLWAHDNMAKGAMTDEAWRAAA